MADDISAYALNLALNIDASLALESIDRVGAGLSALDDNIRQIADAFQGSINPQLQAAVEYTEQLATTSANVLEQFSGVSTQLRDTVNQNRELLDLQQQIIDIANEQNDTSVDMNDQSRDRSNMLDEQVDLTEDLRDSTEEIAGIWGTVHDQIMGAAAGIAGMLFGLDVIRASFGALVDEELAFVNATYRGYGSVQDLIKLSSETAEKFNILRGEALEAIKLLGQYHATFGDQLQQYAQNMAMFNKITGVSRDLISEWMRRVKMSGWTMINVSDYLNKMTTSMSKFGMTSQDVTKLMQTQVDKAGWRYVMWGEEGSRQINELQARTVAYAKALGGNADSFRNVTDAIIDNNLNAVQLTAIMGKMPDEWARWNKMQQQSWLLENGIVQAADNLNKKMAEMRASGQQLAIQPLMETYAKMIGVSYEDLANIIQTVGANNVKTGADLQRLAIMRAGKDPYDLAKQNENAMNLLANNFAKAKEAAFVGWQELFIEIEPAITAMINGLRWLSVQVRDLIRWAIQLANSLGPLTDIISGVWNWITGLGTAISTAVPWLGKLGQVLLFAGGAFLLFGGASRILGFVGGLITRFITSVISFALAPLRALFVALGRLFSGINPVQFIAVAAGALMLAGAFWILSKAFSELAALGWKVIGPLAVLLVVGAAFVGLVAALTAVGIPAAPVLLALGFAAIVLAGSMLILAYAFSIVTNAAIALIGAGAGQLALVGMAFIAFGFGVMTGSFMLMAGAAILLPAAALFAVGAAVLAGAVWLLNVDKIKTIAEAMYKLAWSVLTLSRNDVSVIGRTGKELFGFSRSIKSAADELSLSASGLLVSAGLLSLAFGAITTALSVLDVSRLDSVIDDLSKLSGISEPIRLLAAASAGLPEIAAGVASALTQLRMAISDTAMMLFGSATVIVGSVSMYAIGLRAFNNIIESVNLARIYLLATGINYLAAVMGSEVSLSAIMRLSAGVDMFSSAIDKGALAIVSGARTIVSIVTMIGQLPLGSVLKFYLVSRSLLDALNTLVVGITGINPIAAAVQLFAFASMTNLALSSVDAAIVGFDASASRLGTTFDNISHAARAAGDGSILSIGTQIDVLNEKLGDLRSFDGGFDINIDTEWIAQINDLIPQVENAYGSLEKVVTAGVNRVATQVNRLTQLSDGIRSVASNLGVPTETIITAEKPEPVLAETIATVKVVKDGGTSAIDSNREIQLLTTQNELLGKLVAGLQSVMGDEKTHKITDLLEEYLPEIGRSSRSSSLANWS